MNPNKSEDIAYLAYLNRESHQRHHRYDEELKQYYYISAGDIEGARQAGGEMFTSALTGKLSQDDLRHEQYLFVASTTLATRFAIQGGMDEEAAYNTSDLYIQTLDVCQQLEEIISLQKEMMGTFAKGVKRAQTVSINRLPILRVIQYIEDHLHERIRNKDLAQAIGYSDKYLSKIFRQEMGQSLQDYIQAKKIQLAQNMLTSGHFSIIEVADTLAFSSQSYFSKIFKSHTGLTPKAYQLSPDRRKLAVGANQNQDEAKL